jgi:hypothetical protein
MAISKNALRCRKQRRKKAEAEGREIRAWNKQSEEQTPTDYRRERKNKLRAIAATHNPPKTGRYALKDAHVKAYQLHAEKQSKDVELQRLKDAGMKLCRRCESVLNVGRFSKNAAASDGLMPLCKACDAQKSKERRDKNKAAHLARRRDLYKKNAAQMRAASKRYKTENRDLVNKRLREKRKEDPLFKLRENIKKRLKDALKRGGYTKTSKTMQILGCTAKELKEHIERQFTKGMSWATLGSEIHIDHIIPLATAKSEEDLIALNHFTNLRPMWAKQNMEKSDAVLFLL